MGEILIVGSGASAVHFALTVLSKGYTVIMLDVGYRKSHVTRPDDCFIDLKDNLSDPAKYFLGENLQGIIYPDFESEYYGFPPTKDYIFKKVDGFDYQSDGFAPLFSFAQGGLAETWTAGAYPLNDSELINFPFSYNDFEPYYNEAANRIGISGVNDDLVRYYPFHRHIMPALDLDQHSELLLNNYKKHKYFLNNKLGIFLGRSRVATLSQDKENRTKCRQTGRCLWGCPSGSLYTPSITLNQCKQYSNFRYIPGTYVKHFRYNLNGHITSVITESLEKKKTYEFPVDRLVLGAGTLSSSKIFLESIYRNTGEILKLRGLMDNRQILVPFVNLKMIGKAYNPKSYQYHQVALGIASENPINYIHGQITTLKTALVHPIVQNIPFDLKTSIHLFSLLRSALGILNINFNDNRRTENYLTLKKFLKSDETKLLINYSSSLNEKFELKRIIKKVKKALLKLGCLVPPSVIHVRPMGASAHYAGTIPISTERKTLTTTNYCQSHDFENLYIVDGTTFPFLPAKNLTFTLMANAIRVANNAF